MPDASSHRTLPSGWSEALAALPTEAPPAGGWERVARALPVRRRRWPALVALAAALALVAIVPLRRAVQDVAPSAPIVHAPATTEPARIAATQPTPAAPIQPAQMAEASRSALHPAAVASDDEATFARVAAGPATGPTTDPARAPAIPAPGASTQPSTGTTEAPQLAAPSAPASRDATVEPATMPELERLYAESAQLEGLLALARDGGAEVANGAVAMLSDDLATRVARIDAALMQPSLGNERRIALWRERVDALRQAAAFESTQRLLAARGQQYDAMLVSID